MLLAENAVVLRRPRSRSPSPAPKEVHQTGIVVGGGQAKRQIEIFNEDCTECIMIGAAGATKTTEVMDIVGALCQKDPSTLRLTSKIGSYMRTQSIHDEVASKVTVLGIKSFKRKVAEYKHPLVVIGGGLGGLQTCMNLQERNRLDFVCLEKLGDFGGHSWMVVSNQFTKLQTEKGTYHLNYMRADAEIPQYFGNVKYSTWPSRDALLSMFRNQAAENGLYNYARFNTAVEKVKVLPGFGSYALATMPSDSDEPGEMIMGGAVLTWPGNLCDVRLLDFPGEEEFGGYIEYSSFCKVDYALTEGKITVLYGHGAFTIENVRTLVEHRCKKVIVMCRKRNLCGMKMVSWMVGQSEVPVPGPILVKAFQQMYDLVGFDVWSAHSVKTDSKRSFAHISQKTVFGVTDIYFLAGYYGLMEVVVDEIKRLTNFTAHTKKGKKIGCECIIKAIGTVPSFKIDKMLGCKSLYGMWVNGDCLRPVCCNGMFVEARNFGSFSSGPGFATQAFMITWFIDFPWDFDAVKGGTLPTQKASETPAYVPSSMHLLPTFTNLQQALPALSAEMSQRDNLKARKQKLGHPMHEFLGECKAEWETYIKMFKTYGMVDDRPEPPYPYTIPIMEGYIQETVEAFFKKYG